MKERQSNITFFLLCALLIFAPLARGGVQGWAIIIIHIMTLAAVAVLLIQKSLDWDWTWIRTPLDGPIFFLLILAAASTWNSSIQAASFRAMLLLVNYVAVYYLVIHVVINAEKLYDFAWLIICLGIFLAIFGILKFSGLKFFPWFHYEDLPNFGALTSTYGNPNHMAGFFEMAIGLVFGLLLAADKARLQAKYHVPILFLFGTALILTMSRGGWTCSMLSLVFLAAVLVFKQDFPRHGTLITLSAGAVLLFLVMLSSFPAVQELLTIPAVIDKAGGFESRMQVSKAVGVMIADRPLLGFGPGTFAYSFFKYQPAGIQGWYNMAHNDYAHFTAELGIFFPLLMVWMAIALFRHGFCIFEGANLLARSIALGAMAGIVAILCHSFIDFNLHIPVNALLFTVLCGLVTAAGNMIHKA